MRLVSAALLLRVVIGRVRRFRLRLLAMLLLAMVRRRGLTIAVATALLRCHRRPLIRLRRRRITGVRRRTRLRRVLPTPRLSPPAVYRIVRP